jgi:hypothetical protein
MGELKSIHLIKRPQQKVGPHWFRIDNLTRLCRHTAVLLRPRLGLLRKTLRLPAHHAFRIHPQERMELKEQEQTVML